MPDFRRVTDLVAARGGASWLTVVRGGEVLLDRRTGCEPDALFFAFSVSKRFVALAVHLLAERGMLRLDDPVAAHWPAYARGDKSAITIRHVLSHRAGVRTPREASSATRTRGGRSRPRRTRDRAGRQAR